MSAKRRFFYTSALLVTMAYTLAACATPRERVVYREVKVPLPVPCTVTVPERPAYAADAVDLGADIFALVQALLADRAQRQARELELEAAAKSCS